MKPIITVKKDFKLFTYEWLEDNAFKAHTNPPPVIGDVLEHENKSWLIIGVEQIEVDGYGGDLIVWYTLQDPQKEIPRSTSATLDRSHIAELSLTLRAKLSHGFYTYSDYKQAVLDYRPGRFFYVQDIPFKCLEYSGIQMKGKNILIDLLAKRVQPVSHKEGKAKLLHARKTKLQLEVIR
ncbi:hypothetical protein IC619_015320 [Hazenella sp. IB182353]|uniref:hypothetical protein n=1 Tax=Polycladospora coralii TaxID=2771432 RepID=UPI001747523C|nr:hypothetical protein [Polycladospora coralii]MBS7531842.1 hypothetical protein [Polycladospora coralii]